MTKIFLIAVMTMVLGVTTACVNDARTSSSRLELSATPNKVPVCDPVDVDCRDDTGDGGGGGGDDGDDTTGGGGVGGAPPGTCTMALCDPLIGWSSDFACIQWCHSLAARCWPRADTSLGHVGYCG